jgi:hypothetical protein
MVRDFCMLTVPFYENQLKLLIELILILISSSC